METTAKQINKTLMRCKCAAHGKTKKAQRRKDKVDLKKQFN